MTEILAAAAVFAAIVVLYVLVGARRGGGRVMDRTGANAVLFADRRRELIAEGRVQSLDKSILGELEEELALDLIEADRPAADLSPGAAEGARPPLRAVALIAVLLAAIAVGLYSIWGEPHARDLALAGRALADVNADAGALMQAEQALADRVARDPEDATSWYLLGHARMRLADHAAAAQAFAGLRDVAGPNEEVDAAWAQASYLAQGGMNAETRQVVEDVLAARPDHPAMLEMLAMDAMRRGAFAEAAGYLSRAIGQPLPESRLGLLAQLLTVAQSRLDPERPLIEVAVNAGDAPPRQWLMVFARPLGGGMPLAVVRRRAQASQTVILDDTAGMGAGPRLSAGGSVEVVARLSDSGNAAAGDNDLEASSEPVDAETQPRIELTFAAAAGSEMAVLAVDVSLDAAFDVAPAATVFVIARPADRAGPPLAVKRLAVGDLPARVELTNADAMLPGRGLGGVETVELVARVALGGSAAAAAGDLESSTWAGSPGGEIISLHIDRRLP